MVVNSRPLKPGNPSILRIDFRNGRIRFFTEEAVPSGVPAGRRYRVAAPIRWLEICSSGRPL